MRSDLPSPSSEDSGECAYEEFNIRVVRPPEKEKVMVTSITNLSQTIKVAEKGFDHCQNVRISFGNTLDRVHGIPDHWVRDQKELFKADERFDKVRLLRTSDTPTATPRAGSDDFSETHGTVREMVVDASSQVGLHSTTYDGGLDTSALGSFLQHIRFSKESSETLSPRISARGDEKSSETLSPRISARGDEKSSETLSPRISARGDEKSSETLSSFQSCPDQLKTADFGVNPGTRTSELEKSSSPTELQSESVGGAAAPPMEKDWEKRQKYRYSGLTSSLKELIIERNRLEEERKEAEMLNRFAGVKMSIPNSRDSSPRRIMPASSPYRASRVESSPRLFDGPLVWQEPRNIYKDMGQFEEVQCLCLLVLVVVAVYFYIFYW